METRAEVVELAALTAEELERRAERFLSLAKELRGQAQELTQELTPSAHPKSGNGNGNGKEMARELEGILGRAMKPPEEPGEPREGDTVRIEGQVGRFGRITEQKALLVAQALGRFRQNQFAEKLGLRPPAHNRWLTILHSQGHLHYESGEWICTSKPILRDWVVNQEESFSPEDAAQATGQGKEETLAELHKFVERKMVKEMGTTGLFRYIPPDPSQGPRERPRERPPEDAVRVPVPERGRAIRRSAMDKATSRDRSLPGRRHQLAQRDKRYTKQEEAKAERAARRRGKK